MDGMNANFPGGNANMLQQMSNYSNIQNISNPTAVQQPNMTNNNIAPELNPKRQAVVDRLKKRMGNYRKRQNEAIPRFDQTFSGICEQQSMETNVLQKRFVESKAKRVAKKSDKKTNDVTSNVTVTQTKQMKRPAMDDLENDGEVLAPAAKMPATGNNTAIDNMKFQVEIVQQLEFTTSVANMQPQQISTNVTVKAMTNGSVKYEPQEMKPQKMEPGKMQTMVPLPPPAPDILQDFKQEPDNEFADLDFGGLANFMANDENELKKLFSNISEVFDQDLFDQDKIKQEPRPPQNIPQMTQQNINQMNQVNQQFNQYVMMPDSCQMQKPMMQQQHRMYQQPQQVPQQQIPEMSPAAQTLKNMAQQHQVKNSMAMNYMRPTVQPMVPQMNQQQQQQPNMNQRMPYQQQQQQQQQFNDYSGQFHKNQIQMPFPPEMIKQEMMMQQQQPQMPPMHQMKPMNHQMNMPMVHPNEDLKMNQQYQQYQNTQFVANHQPQQQRNTFNPGQNSMNIHMKQTQMMHIQQPNGGGNIQMQGGQHMHFAGDMKMGDGGGNFSMQQQQNMYFNHHTHQPNTHPQYGNMQAMQKRQQIHPNMGGGEGPTNTYNMMQSQTMSFTQ